MPKISRILIVSFIVVNFGVNMTWAETIILKSGRAIKSHILEKIDTSIKVDINGASVTFYTDEIERIEEDNETSSLNENDSSS